MACTRPPSMVKSKTTLAAPRWNQAAPGRPPTKTGSAALALPLKNVATSSRTSICRGVPTSTAASTADGGVGCEQSKQPVEVTVLGCGHEGVDHFPVGQTVLEMGLGDLARAREASLRAAAGVVSRTAAIVGNSKPKLSWSTKATRSSGEKRSSTTA